MKWKSSKTVFYRLRNLKTNKHYGIVWYISFIPDRICDGQSYIIEVQLDRETGTLFPDRHSFADFVDAVDGCRRYSAYKSLDFSGECLAHPIAFVPDDFLSERTCSGDSETGLFRFLRF